MKHQHSGSAHSRGYDRKWSKLRDQTVIESDFKCQSCGRFVVLRKKEATGNMQVARVDHIKSIKEAPELRLDESNLRCLCESCHNRHTAFTQGFHKSRPYRPSGSYDAHGWPLDGRHGWNKEG